jgi:succinyl-diaminopimelate desuccinylase
MKELLTKLIQAESTAQKGELAAARIIAEEFAHSGIDCRIDTWDQDRANVAATVKSDGQKGTLLFLCHLDVVAAGKDGWNYPPFTAVESNGRIYGRGAMDMKGGTAAAVTAIRQIADSGTKLKGDCLFAALAGEETDSCGAARFVSDLRDKSQKLTGVIVPEPTNFDVVTAHRGILWLEIKTAGKAAHSSAPELGVNAITSMKLLLNALDNYKIQFEPHKLLGNCSMSINTIAGGKEINVVPDNCSIAIDIRTLPGQNHGEIISDFEKIFTEIKQKNPQFEASVSVVRQIDAMETDSNCDFVKCFCSVVGAGKTKAVGFTTDGPHFASLGVPIVIFGPGKPQLAHKPNEYIDIADLQKAVEYYKKIILKFLA